MWTWLTPFWGIIFWNSISQRWSQDCYPLHHQDWDLRQVGEDAALDRHPGKRFSFVWLIKSQLCTHPHSASVRRSNPHGSSCSACFSEMPICSMWGVAGGMKLCLASRERVNMENHPFNLHVFNFGRLQYFFLIFHFSLSPFFPVIVLVLFWSFVHALLCILFFFLLWFIPFFF